jgi:hypothetical protein
MDAPGATPPPVVWTGAALFVLALVLRILFWQATPDASWPYTAWLKGDAPIWLEYARALHHERPFELGLPIHPPGAAYLVAALWDGEAAGIPWLRFAWAALGALVVVLVYAAVLRSFNFTVACLAGLVAAASTGLMILATSVNNETPYLLLAVASLCFFEDLRTRPRPWPLAAWSVLHGVACLFRVEHLLFYLLSLGLLALLWRNPDGSLPARARWRPSVVGVAASALFFVLPLVPWHLTAWRAIERFNTQPPEPSPGEQAAFGQVEARLQGLRWDAGAEAARERLPAFLRRSSALFVAATVAHRGASEVRAQDFLLLEDAFGYLPRPLGRFPFVSSYGPINFALANHPGAAGGFSPAPLEEPPPLAPSRTSYPRDLVSGLPPPQLSFVYPPHLALFNEGYTRGWDWIRASPGRFLALAARKLRIFWSGAALGFTGYNLPLGLSGTRRAVDLVVPESGWGERTWGLAILAACVLGGLAAAGQPALYAWLLFLLSKVAVTVFFFGYARQGATVIPVVALLVALAAERRLLRRTTIPVRRLAAGAALVGVLALGLEAARFLAGPTVVIDGRVAGASDPFADDLGHRIDVR